MADGAVLPVPQHHEADDDDRGNGYRNGQQTHEGTAVQIEVHLQGPHGFQPLLEVSDSLGIENHFLHIQCLVNDHIFIHFLLT